MTSVDETFGRNLCWVRGRTNNAGGGALSEHVPLQPPWQVEGEKLVDSGRQLSDDPTQALVQLLHCLRGPRNLRDERVLMNLFLHTFPTERNVYKKTRLYKTTLKE